MAADLQKCCFEDEQRKEGRKRHARKNLFDGAEEGVYRAGACSKVV